MSMHSNRYLNVWMKSRKVAEDNKKTVKGEIKVSLDDKVKKLRELLEQYPEMENSDMFDEELEKRRKLYGEIRDEVEELRNDMERIWADNAWKNVKNKPG